MCSNLNIGTFQNSLWDSAAILKLLEAGLKIVMKKCAFCQSFRLFSARLLSPGLIFWLSCLPLHDDVARNRFQGTAPLS